MSTTQNKIRPYIRCLMMTSVDGKILGDQWGNDPQVKKLVGKFEEIHEVIGVKAWIVGRTTMEKDFTEFAKPGYKEVDKPIDRSDHIANANAGSYAIALDAKGKLGWYAANMQGDHVISVLTEQIPDSYLAHLREIGVSYIFGGKNSIDLPLILQKLRLAFGIEELMLEGGGHINGSFLNEGLIDELHQLLLPIADGNAENASLFEIAAKDKHGGAVLLKLDSYKQIEDEVLWLTYKVKSNK